MAISGDGPAEPGNSASEAELGTSDATPPDRSRRAHLVLLGCALQQIPVWGFQMAFGIIEQYESTHSTIRGDRRTIGIVGTTMTGVIYIAMPFVSAFLTRYSDRHKLCSAVGGIVTAASLVAAAFSTSVWHLICSLGVLHGLGVALLYTSTMMILNTWFIERKGLAFSITLVTKAVTGTATPFLISLLLDRLGLRNTMLVWATVALLLSLPTALVLSPQISARMISSTSITPRKIPWDLLRNPTAWSFVLASAIFSSGYGLPQTYLASYASQVLNLSTPLSSSMLAMLALSSAPSAIAFGMLSDRDVKILGWDITAHSTTAMTALGSAIPVLFLWGFGSSAAILIVFSLTYGFFAGAYSAIWPGVMKEVSRERSSKDESDNGLVFALLNGGRGMGFVVGGLIGSRLLETGSIPAGDGFIYGYGSTYGSLILFVGITSFFGALNLPWKAWCHLFNKQVSAGAVSS